MRPSSPWGHRPVERLRVLGLQANPARGGKRGRLEPGEAPGRPLELSSESELPGRSQCRRPLQGQPKASVKVKFKGSTRGSLAGPGTRPCDSPGRRGHPAPCPEQAATKSALGGDASFRTGSRGCLFPVTHRGHPSKGLQGLVLAWCPGRAWSSVALGLSGPQLPRIQMTWKLEVLMRSSFRGAEGPWVGQEKGLACLSKHGLSIYGRAAGLGHPGGQPGARGLHP